MQATASSSNTPMKDVLDSGELNETSQVLAAAKVGTMLAAGGGGGFIVHEKGLVVASNKTVTTYTVEAVLACVTTTTGTKTRRVPISNAGTLATGQVQGKDSSAVATKEIDFYASDVADASTADVWYVTNDVPIAADGSSGISLASGIKGVY